MNAFDIFQGIASMLVLMLGIALFDALAKGGWLWLLRLLQATGRFFRGLLHSTAEHLNQLLIQFSHNNLLRWWDGKNAR